MPSELGNKIRTARLQLGIGVRELARIVGISASMVVRLEQDDPPPSASEATLTSVADALELNPDELVVLGGKVPDDVKPKSADEVALFRKVKRLSPGRLKKLLDEDNEEP